MDAGKTMYKKKKKKQISPPLGHLHPVHSDPDTK